MLCEFFEGGGTVIPTSSSRRGGEECVGFIHKEYADGGFGDETAGFFNGAGFAFEINEIVADEMNLFSSKFTSTWLGPEYALVFPDFDKARRFLSKTEVLSTADNAVDAIGKPIEVTHALVCLSSVHYPFHLSLFGTVATA
jgi:hypothetical protein